MTEGPTTAVLPIDPDAPAPDLLERAARVLKGGGLVAFPTETFYGLGAAALDARAVRRVFAAKGRPESKPLLVLLDSPAMVEQVAVDVPPRARELMGRYWPGPLTLVLRAAAAVPPELTAGTGTVGVRVSSHPVARGLVAALGAPVTAPSANTSGAAPPTTARRVLDDLGAAVALVLDGGSTRGGLPSTILDLTVDPPRIVRAGALELPGPGAMTRRGEPPR